MIKINDYGFTKFYEEDMDLGENSIENLIFARVVEVHRDLFKIISEHGESNARIKGSLYNNVVYAEEFPAVGDFVLIKYNELGDSQIIKVCKRKSKFSRSNNSGHAAGYAKTILEQVVAANFDYVFILVSLNHDFNVNRILRYITASWESGGVPVILLTKSDLLDDYSDQLAQIQEQAIGVDVIALSAYNGHGMDKLNHYLKPGNTIVFLGSSGVGKSTLVNALTGEEIMTVNGIRENDSKGRHTTTHRQLIKLNNGVMVIDTPGMREMGMWDIDEGLQEAFSDIEDLMLQCKFSNCTHNNEPGCAIKRALEEKTLEYSRWKNYLNLKSESRYVENKSQYLRNKDKFMKKVSIDARAKKRAGYKK